MANTSESFDFSAFKFAPVIHLPKHYDIYDFSAGYDPDRYRESTFGIGRYNEDRPGMYNADLFTPSSNDARTIHVGVDIGAPEDTPVHTFYDGEIYLCGINPAVGDYGGTVITQHHFEFRSSIVTLYALHGHLSHHSVSLRKNGDKIAKGDTIGYVGNKTENGGWNPHLHFQLSWTKPERCDLPGAVNKKDLAWALATFPDPRNVLGPLY